MSNVVGINNAFFWDSRKRPKSDQDEIKKLQLLLQKYPWMAKSMSLGPIEEEVYYYCVSQGAHVYTDQIAAHFDLSIQNAWAKLNSLYKKGYLAKTPGVAESGGIENMWFAVVLLEKNKG